MFDRHQVCLTLLRLSMYMRVRETTYLGVVMGESSLSLMIFSRATSACRMEGVEGFFVECLGDRLTLES